MAIDWLGLQFPSSRSTVLGRLPNSSGHCTIVFDHILDVDFALWPSYCGIYIVAFTLHPSYCDLHVVDPVDFNSNFDAF